MTTPSHLIYNLVLFGKKGASQVNWAVALGALVPDSVVYIFFLIYTFIFQMPQQEIWRDLYFNSAWSPFFNLSHSLWVFPVGLLIAYVWKKHVAVYFFISAIFHIVLDFFVHAEDAYAHFYPLSDWVFNSPISYWNPAYYGNYISVIEWTLHLVALYVLMKRLTKKKHSLWLGAYAVLVSSVLVISLMRIV